MKSFYVKKQEFCLTLAQFYSISFLFYLHRNAENDPLDDVITLFDLCHCLDKEYS